jgi:anthranilate synthase/aminodeoxychorismate synthase-like glutamine amidotransferase
MLGDLLIVDNYDSFTHNLAQAFGALGARVEVVRSDALSVEQIMRGAPPRIVVSPGPGRPVDAGVSVELITAAAGRVALLGVCLGHQCLAQAFGGRIVHAPVIMHGKTCRVEHAGDGLFQGLPAGFEAARYNSLTVDPQSLPGQLEATAWSADTDGPRVLMGLRHRRYPLFGVQFHPESFLTPLGPVMLTNFLEGCW